MVILTPLSEKSTRNRFIVIIHSNPTGATSTKTTTAPKTTTALTNCCIMPYGISDFFLAGNAPQVVSQFNDSMYLHLGRRLLTTTAYNPKSNGQTEAFHKTIANRLLHYVMSTKMIEIRLFTVEICVWLSSASLYERRSLPFYIDKRTLVTCRQNSGIRYCEQWKQDDTSSIVEIETSITHQNNENKDGLDR